MAASLLPTDLFIARLINTLTPQASPHFLMIRTRYRLALALAASLLLHLAPFVTERIPAPSPPPPPPPMQASLHPVQAPPPQAPLRLDETPAQPKTAKQTTKPIKNLTTSHSPNSWQQEVRRQFQKLHGKGLFYPPEAIEKGLQGEALVLLILDPDGHVTAARIEQSSGFRILDEAALQAARSLRSLPADAPRETLLPVSFRLK
ncbi:energy transducer TonB [Azonexus sp. IMCC34842]|uniref:energy transducer TonB n=1 Tax=Azonexus sp. IMCC34842 TaxID=3420950 RepID=UPI003D1434C3